MPHHNRNGISSAAKNDNNNDSELRRAFAKVLDELGPSARAALLYHLREHYDFVLDDIDSLSLDELEAILRRLLKGGADIVVEMIKKQMQNDREIKSHTSKI